VSECISSHELTRSLQSREFGASQLRFGIPDEIEEGWAKIELLPTSAIQQLDVIRYAHRELCKLLDGLSPDHKFKPFTENSDVHLKTYLDFLTTLQGSCTKVQIHLNIAITALT
jgi:hypothetical protein